MRAVLMLAAATLAMACDPTCAEQREVVEVIWSDSFDLLATFEGAGWDCSSDGAIRNGSGQQIGTRYVCTRCA